MAIYTANDVAAEIRRRLPSVPTKKLHKLLYYCQGYHSAAFGAPLFGDDIEAWDRGPVVASLWRDEKYGQHVPTRVVRLGQSELNTIGYVVSRYGAMTGADLEALTHHEVPWMIANERRQLTGDQAMPLDEIKGFFRSARPYDQPDTDFDDPDEQYQPPAGLIAAWLSGAVDRLNDDLAVDDLDAMDAVAGP